MEGEKGKSICQRNGEGKKSSGGEVPQFLGHLMCVALEMRGLILRSRREARRERE